MKNKTSNPQAFPVPNPGTIGMTLRDYFASAALTGLLSNTPLRFQDVTNTNDMALLSYNIADAMLKAREAND